MKNMNFIFLFLTSNILIENCCLAGKHADEAAKTETRRRRNEQIQKEFNGLIDKQIARFSKDSYERKENQQNQVEVREEISEEDCVENIIAKLPKIKIKEVTRKDIQNANVSSTSNAKEIEKFSTNLSKLTLSNTHTNQLNDQTMELPDQNFGRVDQRNVQMPMQMPMEVSNEHVNSVNSQKLKSTAQNYVDQAHPMSEGTADSNLISLKSDQIGSETSNSQQKRARHRKQSTSNIQRTEFINEGKGYFSFTPKASEEPIVKYIEKQSDQRTESVDQNIEVSKQTNLPLDLIKANANSVISQKANRNTKVNADQTHSMPEGATANDQNIEVPKQTNLPLDLIKANANSVISQKANQNTKVNADQTHSMSEGATANDQNIEVPKQTNLPLDLIKANANSVISQKANQNTKVNADQTHSMSERTSAKLKTVKSDQSSKKKFQVDHKIKKTGQIDQQTTKIQRKRGMPKIKSLSQIYQSDSVTTNTKESNSTDQKSYEGPKSQQIDKQSALIVIKRNNHIDQSNFAGTNDQQMDETSELSQMVQLVMDDLMSPQHEGDMMSNNKPTLMTKKDLRVDQSIYEESPSRKRGRPKKEKIEEKKPNGKPKMVKENTQPKSAVETKSDSNKKSAGTNLNGAVKKIRYNPEYPITKILAMYVYRKKNNMQRIYFVEWEEDNETHSCWVISENTEAQELVANFIEECSIRSALDAFLGAPVMSHVAKLLQNNEEAKLVMQSMGKQPEEMAAEDDYFVFAKEATKGMKKRAIETIDEFVKFIRRKASNA